MHDKCLYAVSILDIFQTFGNFKKILVKMCHTQFLQTIGEYITRLIYIGECNLVFFPLICRAARVDSLTFVVFFAHTPMIVTLDSEVVKVCCMVQLIYELMLAHLYRSLWHRADLTSYYYRSIHLHNVAIGFQYEQRPSKT